jgi:putative phage-type endonuclease
MSEPDLDNITQSLAELSLTSPKPQPETNAEKIARFRRMPKYPQKSSGWLNQRTNYLTASTIAAALRKAGQVARSQLLIEKGSNGKIQTFTGNICTHWGNKYEPVANALYSSRHDNCVIEEFGMITNDKYPILGISPDGIIDDHMLEIKCTYSRIINGKIKPEYYHQMQEQLTVCEYDWSHFMECAFNELTLEQFLIDQEIEYHVELNDNPELGAILVYLDLSDLKDTPDLTPKYIYSPVYLNHSQAIEWSQRETENIANDSMRILLYRSFWTIKTLSLQRVDRDPMWIIENYPILEAFWEEVVYYREHPEELLRDHGNPVDNIPDAQVHVKTAFSAIKGKGCLC